MSSRQRRAKLVNRPTIAITTTVIAATSTLAIVAHPAVSSAAPPGFPDVDSFQSVDPAQYTMQSGRGGGGVFFATPDGLQCGWASLASGPDAHVSVGCSGPIPGLPGAGPGGGCDGVNVATALASDLGPYLFQKGTCPVITSPLLNVGQKITAANTTCVVGADRLTACIDPILNRGFVLQPSGSWTF